MEQKLNELKRQWCKFYCPDKDKEVFECIGEVYCKHCDDVVPCDKHDVEKDNYCNLCKVDDFINYIIWEL